MDLYLQEIEGNAVSTKMTRDYIYISFLVREIINEHVFTSDSQSVNIGTEMHIYLCNNSSEYCHFHTFLSD